MTLFKALVFTMMNATGFPVPVEIGPFESQAQCVEAGRSILGPAVQSVRTTADSIVGVVKLQYNSDADDVRTAAITVRCYEVAPAPH